MHEAASKAVAIRKCVLMPFLRVRALPGQSGVASRVELKSFAL
jgi:hypothetical protein